MGYLVNSTDVDWTIPATKFYRAYEAIRYLRSHPRLSIQEILIGIIGDHFESSIDDEGNLRLAFFNGEKAGWGEEELLEALAPLSTPGSYVVWRGEDDSMWRNIVIDGELVTQWPKEIVWQE